MTNLTEARVREIVREEIAKANAATSETVTCPSCGSAAWYMVGVDPLCTGRCGDCGNVFMDHRLKWPTTPSPVLARGKGQAATGQAAASTTPGQSGGEGTTPATCPTCGGTQEHPQSVPKHDPRCDGSCRVGCPVPTECDDYGFHDGLETAPAPDHEAVLRRWATDLHSRRSVNQKLGEVVAAVLAGADAIAGGRRLREEKVRAEAAERDRDEVLRDAVICANRVRDEYPVSYEKGNTNDADIARDVNAARRILRAAGLPPEVVR